MFDVQGHRGARGYLPENTIPGFLLAVDLGVTTVELDVVVSGDGRLVASHDPWFDARICRAPDGRRLSPEPAERRLLYAMTYEEIAKYDCGGLGHPDFPEQRPVAAVKPLLVDAVEAVEAHVRLRGLRPVRYNIETKSRPEWDGVMHPPPAEFVALLLEELQPLGVLPRVTIQSFDVRTLQAARDMDPSIELSLLVENDLSVSENLERLGFTPDIYSPDHRLVDAALVAEALARGMRVLPWTVNDPTDIARLRALGVAGVITDYPDRALAQAPPSNWAPSRPGS